jgi:tetratricopeptide (TPR) repeat protein
MSSEPITSSLSTVSNAWQRLLTHFEWGAGFSFIVVLAPNPQDAEIRRQALERTLAAEHKTITQLRFASPEELMQLAARLLDLQIAADTGAIWVAAVVSEAAPDFAAWQSAWREAVARLNQFRNHLQQRFPVTMLFVGATELAETIRTYAPDLWSVRTLVVEIEPDVSPLRDLQAANARNAQTSHPFIISPNIELALDAAEKLRGRAGYEHELVRYLLRAGAGLYEAADLLRAEEVVSEAVLLQSQIDDSSEEMAISLGLLGDIQLVLSEPKAKEHLEKALSIYHHLENELGEAECLRALGDWFNNKSDLQSALSKYETALQLYQKVKDLLGQANCLKGIASIALQQSNYEKAKQNLEQSLSLFRQAGSVFGEATSIRNLGDIALRQSNYIKAQQLFEEALTLFGQINDTLGQATSLACLGEISSRLTSYSTAKQQYEEALRLYRMTGSTLGEANCLRSLGEIARNQSKIDEARHYQEMALPLYRQIGDKLGEANSLFDLGEVALIKKEYRVAYALYEQATPLFKEIGDILGEANCIRSLGDILLVRLEYEKAKANYVAALALFRQIGSIRGEANCNLSLGEVDIRGEDFDAAQEQYSKALALFRKVGDLLGEANCLQRLGIVAVKKTQIEQAWESFKMALSLYQRIPNMASIGETYRWLARLASDNEERNRFLEAARFAWTQIDRRDLVQQLDEEFG